MKINKKINKIGIIFLVLTILFSATIFAFSISAPYMENQQLKLFPGQSAGLEYVLQNGGGATETLFVKAELTEGSEIAKIIEPDKIHELPVGGMISINAEVIIPENAKIGEMHQVRLTFNTVQDPEKKGVFAFGSAISQTFSVVVGEEPAQVETETEKPTPAKTLYVLIGIITIAIIVVIFFIIRKKSVNEIQTTSKQKRR